MGGKIKIKALGPVTAFVFAVLLLFMPLYCSAHADGDKDITLTCLIGSEQIEGVEWRLYRAGERKGGGFVLAGEFAGLPVDINDLSEENISTAAQTLASYVTARNIAELDCVLTGPDGNVTFRGLENGLYLAVGRRTWKDDFVYTSAPLLLEVSDSQQGSGSKAYPKIVRITYSSAPVNYIVRKAWLDDDDRYNARPTSVTVDIYRDSVLFNTVTLSGENNWTYGWGSVGNIHDWQVAERTVPEKYEVRIECNETQYLIRNRHSDVDVQEGDTTQTTSSGDAVITTTVTAAEVPEGSGSGSEDATAPARTTTKSSSDDGGSTRLPQTGQLWWPVIPLAAGGVLLILAGFGLRPEKDEDED